ncbi:3-hydroxybutyryl-CoA dehydrogenase [Thermotomaculum hydrothermale]|uniref:3-hydroxybutyryl-CoA dehydrogenase n=1 Tax=Thermotomaculum hydrothermale TaxID=981385 RepID=A0A7R6SYP3_9BACT|nr:3-hydroxybutyryl-CoA dehydrogenase [Thermotomaculum hydrothermale]BBB32040.1 3-hydroxybutyryl-CoA dehydrogenase [Thermotomaculum hydrothermale]
MEIKKVGVCGAGTMGNGIAHVFAQFGFEVVMRDVKDEFVERGLKTIDKNLQRGVNKGRMTEEEKKEILGRITPTTDLNMLKDCDFVVEAITENFEIKKQLIQDLDNMLRDEVIIASNTSSISITKLAALTKRPDRVIGMHFMNPVPVMKLVEIIRGAQTSDETFKTVKELTEKLNKVGVEVNDFPGFVSNRILMPMINEAIFALMEGVGTPEAIDEVMKLGMNHPMGPLTLADFIGLDVCLFIMNVLYEGFKDPKYRPCPLLVKMVDAGYLGRKSGKGFYDYTNE